MAYTEISNSLIQRKLGLLGRGIRTILDQWKNATPTTYPNYGCERYNAEARESKIHLANVWKTVSKNDTTTDTTTDTVTLVTQMGEERLEVIDRVLQNWPGPVSVAVYISSKSVANLPKTLLQMNSSLLNRENVDLHLVLKSGVRSP